MNTPPWLDLLWRAFTVAGTIVVFMVWRHASTLRDPLMRARLAALALGLTASALWAAIILDEFLRWTAKSPAPPIFVLALRLSWYAAAYGLALLLPGWLPRLSLVGRPGPTRCRVIAALGWLTLFGLAIVMMTSGLMTSFASSLKEWLGGLVDVGIPVMAVALLALTMIRAAREMGGGLGPSEQTG